MRYRRIVSSAAASDRNFSASNCTECRFGDEVKLRGGCLFDHAVNASIIIRITYENGAWHVFCDSSRLVFLSTCLRKSNPHSSDFGELSSSLSLRAEGNRCTISHQILHQFRLAPFSFGPFLRRA